MIHDKLKMRQDVEYRLFGDFLGRPPCYCIVIVNLSDLKLPIMVFP